MCVCVQVCCVRMQISVNKKSQKEKNLLSWWTQRMDVMCVDTDGGCERVGTRMHCMQTQISVKKKRKETYLEAHGCAVCACECVACGSVGVRTRMTVKKKKRKWKERKGNLLNTNPGMQICVACACGCVACGRR